MKKLYSEKTKTTVIREPLTLEEVKDTLLKNNPKGLFVTPYSTKFFCVLIESMNENEIVYRWHAASDKTFITVTWNQFYKAISQYLTNIEFEPFKCFEIHTVQSRMYGCGMQCNECKEEQKQGSC